MKRIEWIDSARYIAIFHVVFIHVLDKFRPDILSYWYTPPYSYLPFLFCAKAAVLFFCVLLGFFASRPHSFSVSGLFNYTVKRYIQFSFYIFLTGVVFVCASYAVTWLFHSPDEFAFRVICDDARYNVIYILRDSFLFEANYNPTLWSMQQFFIASILCYLLGCLSARVKPLLSFTVTAFIIAALLISGSEYLSWVAFCVMGVPARLYVENADKFPFIKKRGVRIALLITAVVLFKLPESTFAYFMYAVASILLIAVCCSSPAAQKKLSTPPLPRLGLLAFGVYVVHTPVNSVLHSSIYPYISAVLPPWLSTLLIFILCIAISTGCAWLLETLYRKLIRTLFRQKAAV